ncbi:MAG: NAD(P)H-dependent oxidoreductase [Candidatus Caenarcaniphilales bacterium]|nr:NAD(P)H-dependent oxidoreductase [Candidatus Caenarcaniphilales bacterium]
MKTIIFSCSERSENLSLRSSKAIQAYIKDSTIIDLSEYHLNIYGTQNDQTQKNLAHLKNEFKAAKQIIFVSPEYNWGLSPNAKNLIDFLSGDSSIWNEKVFMCFGCSAGRGGRLPIIELWKTLNKIIALSNSISIVSPYHIEITANLLDESNEFVNEFKEIARLIFENQAKLLERFDS